jgi:hypothetical protein
VLEAKIKSRTGWDTPALRRRFPHGDRRMIDVVSDVHSSMVENALTCAPSGFRTPDPLIKSQLLYQLS